MKSEVGSSELGSTMPVSRLTNDEKKSPQEPAYDMWTRGLSNSMRRTNWFSEK